MFRQTPSGPTFTQTPLPCEPDPEDEPEPDWGGAVAAGVLAGADAGATVVRRPARSAVACNPGESSFEPRYRTLIMARPS